MPKREITDIGDARLVRALAHPLRIRILGILENRVASPSEIAEELGVPTSNVSYHVRMLRGFRLIKLVRRAQRRGAIEHYYEAVGRIGISDRAWSQVPDAVKEAMTAAILRQIGDYVNSAAQLGGFDRAETHVTRTPMVLDDEGFKQLSKELMAFYERARAIAAESEQRVSSDPHAENIDAGLVLMLFEGQDFTAKPAGSGAQRRARSRSERAARSPA
jgi:DNA-binding transcriptional ArsR family regulator